MKSQRIRLCPLAECGHARMGVERRLTHIHLLNTHLRIPTRSPSDPLPHSLNFIAPVDRHKLVLSVQNDCIYMGNESRRRQGWEVRSWQWGEVKVLMNVKGSRETRQRLTDTWLWSWDKISTPPPFPPHCLPQVHWDLKPYLNASSLWVFPAFSGNIPGS